MLSVPLFVLPIQRDKAWENRRTATITRSASLRNGPLRQMIGLPIACHHAKFYVMRSSESSYNRRIAMVCTLLFESPEKQDRKEQLTIVLLSMTLIIITFGPRIPIRNAHVQLRSYPTASPSTNFKGISILAHVSKPRRLGWAEGTLGYLDTWLAFIVLGVDSVRGRMVFERMDTLPGLGSGPWFHGAINT